MEQYSIKYATKNDVIQPLLMGLSQRGIDIKKRNFFRVLFSEMNSNGECKINANNLAAFCQLSASVIRKYRDFFISHGLISFYRLSAYGSHQSYDVYHLESSRLRDFGVSELREAQASEIQTTDTISLPKSLFKYE